MLKRTLLTALIALSAGGATRANDYYVDAVHGDDAASGTSAGEAWRTITHALTTLDVCCFAEYDTIHVAPGVYDTELGEVFPLRVGPFERLIGDGGPDVTLIDGRGSGFLLRFEDNGLDAIGPELVVQGFSLVNASAGVDILVDWVRQWPTLRDLSIRDMQLEGVYATALAGAVSSFRPTLENVEIENCQVGVFLGESPHAASTAATLRDCSITRCRDVGLWATGGQYVEMTRCRVEANGGTGVLVWGEEDLSFEDSLIALNGGDGIQVDGFPHDVALLRVTIAGNRGCGLGVNAQREVDLSHSIVYGNADDICGADDVVATFCDIGDGDFAGSNGNFSADPLFVAPLSGDYRLGWGSPCVDVDPGAAPGGLDLVGHERPLDGDLDLAAHQDLGALELALLERVGGDPRGSFALEIFGEPGGTSVVWFQAAPLLETPATTPFGDRYLVAALMRPFASVVHGAGPGPTLVRARLFAGIGWTTTVLGFQALSPSTRAPFGQAWTNALAHAVQ